jgi:hypothetical protein
MDRPNLVFAALLLALLSGALASSSARAQSANAQSSSAQPASSSASQSAASLPANNTPAPATGKSTSARSAPVKSSKSAPGKSMAPAPRNLPNRFAGRAGAYYKVVWGIDSLNVKWTESGEVIRFSWRVLDPQRAKALNDKTTNPSLIDPRAGVSLVVPQMEKIGALRQSSTPEVGKSYWMAFSNKGLLVKRGDRVVVVVGPFKADGLVVD